MPGWRCSARFAAAHPLLVAWTLAAVLAAVSYRHLVGAQLAGGALAAFPSTATGFFNELVSGVRTTGLGGTQAASPALGLLGLGGAAALGNTELLQKALLFVLPAVAAVGAERATWRLTGQRVPAVLAGAAYALAPVTMWAFSDGRIPELVFLAGLPWLTTRIRRGSPDARVGAGSAGRSAPAPASPSSLLSSPERCSRPPWWRWCACVAPGGGTRRGGLAASVVALVLAGVLTFPFAWALVDGGAHAVSEFVGVRSFSEVARLSPGDAPGGWLPSFYLPLAAALALVFVSRSLFRPALRAAFTASSVCTWRGRRGRVAARRRVEHAGLPRARGVLHGAAGRDRPGVPAGGRRGA